MFLILTMGGLSLLLASILTPVFRDHMGHLGFLDLPDGKRKNHVIPIPRVGGVPIAVSYAATFLITLILPFSYVSTLRDALPGMWRLILPTVIVFLIGLLDDFKGLNPWLKLVGIGGASALAVWAGVLVTVPRFTTIATHPTLATAITIFWLVACTNAFNLIDGLDGLAAGVGTFAAGTMLVVALTQGNVPLVLVITPLVGCLLGFLFYNFHPASVFLGDSGSLLIGFLLGCYGALWSEKSVTLVAVTVPLLAVSVPLLDVTVSIIRRFLRNRPIFHADRGHIHHKLLDLGFRPRVVVLILYGCCALAAGFSLLASALHSQFAGIIVVLFCVVAVGGVHRLGYAEFARASAMFFQGRFQQIVDAEARLVEFERDLAKAVDLEDCWARILTASSDFGFAGVRMNLGGTVFESAAAPKVGPTWQLRISLSDSQYVNFSRDSNLDVHPLVLTGLAGCVQRILEGRFASLEVAAVRKQASSELNCSPSGGASIAARGGGPA